MFDFCFRYLTGCQAVKTKILSFIISVLAQVTTTFGLKTVLFFVFFAATFSFKLLLFSFADDYLHDKKELILSSVSILQAESNLKVRRIFLYFSLFVSHIK